MRSFLSRCGLFALLALVQLAAPVARPVAQELASYARQEAKRRPDWWLAMPSVVPVSFKKALLANRAWKVALYVGAANLGAGTTGYTSANEVVGTGYTAGGKDLVPTLFTGADGVTAILDFADINWPGATFTCRYALVYDNNAPNKEGFVIDFGADQSVSAGTFLIQWPTPDEVSAILRAA